MRFTIITPSFNRPDFLDETINSVVSQKGHFEIEYIIQDGGSRPEVIRILKDWSERIESGKFKIHCSSLTFKYYVESDLGMYDAINRGFQKGSGDVQAWLNSDDIYFAGALDSVQQILDRNDRIDWVIGRATCINVSSAVIFTEKHSRSVSRPFVLRGNYRADVRFFNWLPQDSIFWRKGLWDKAGPLDTSNRLVSDFKLWQSFARFSDPVKVNCLIGAFRHHGNQLTGNPDAYRNELGPAPKLHIGMRMVCLFTRLAPRTSSWVFKQPFLIRLLRMLGLHKNEILGRVCYWNYQNSEWTIDERPAI